MPEFLIKSSINNSKGTNIINILDNKQMTIWFISVQFDSTALVVVKKGNSGSPRNYPRYETGSTFSNRPSKS